MEFNEFNYYKIIIGAGTSGLQMGYFLEKHGADYMILEQNSIAGSYYQKYPHCKQLMDINKKTNKTHDYNLRYDEYSLLNDENFLFTNYSIEYYPKSEDYHKYLNDFSKYFNLKVKYNEQVVKIYKEDKKYYQNY